jgi:uncharacterized protein (TIGR02466 family)
MLEKLSIGGKASPRFLRELREEIYQIRGIDSAGEIWSRKNYPGGYTSYGSMDQLHQFSTTFQILEKAIDKKVAQFAKNLEMDLSGKKLKMTSFWVNIMSTQVVHTMHIHPLSTISGTFYVQTPKNSSAIKFEDPRLVNFMASPPRKANARKENQRFISVAPKAGQLILFESWMRHEVPPNQSLDDRISLSFNYDWV